MRTDPARSRARKARRVEKAAENAALAALGGIPLLYDVTLPDGTELKATRIAPKRFRTAPGRKQKRKRAPSRKSLVRKADTAFSIHIRAKWPICFVPLCGKATADCFHFFTRAKRSIRWDDRNAVGSCKGHNIIYEQDQAFIDDVRIWFVTRWGQQAWDSLKFDGNQIAKHSSDDLQAIIDDICKRP